MLDIGRVCLKIAGRSAGKYCVIVDKIDDNFVLIDGQVKRKRCNITHLEPTNELVDIKKSAPHADVVKALEKLKITVIPTKPKGKKGQRPMKQRKKKEPHVSEQKEKEQKKEGKKEKQKEEKKQEKNK